MAGRIDFDSARAAVQDCPKCRFSMEPLRSSVLLDRNEGYMLDSRARDDVDDHPITSALLGSPSRYLWRYFVEPIVNKLFGEMKNRARRRVLAEYPTSLVCTHCHYILKRK